MTEAPSSPAPRFATLVELLETRAARQPDQRAYGFLRDGEVEEEWLTYGELDRKARVVGAALEKAASPGERVLLLYPPGLEFIEAFFGSLYTGCVAVPVVPPSPGRPLSDTLGIVSDAQAQVALTTTEFAARMRGAGVWEPLGRAIRPLTTDDVSVESGAQRRGPPSDSDSLAYLQYTSGSTGSPKGVSLTHANALSNMRLVERAFEIDHGDVGVFWLPPYHDMGLVGAILVPLWVCVPSILMSPQAFLHRPGRWLRAMTRHRGTISGAPNFAYDLCAERIPREERLELDLRNWRVAFVGAEPVRAETIERFSRTFAPCGFRREAFAPCYGLAEATLMVSGGPTGSGPVIGTFRASALEQGRVQTCPPGDADARVVVGCGRALHPLEILIVHPVTLKPCRPDEAGEIWVSGSSVAAGYWNRNADGRHTFRARSAGTGHRDYLRTGDLGFLKDGELFLTGRLKELIIVRGRNLHPQDIEATAERSHPAIRAGRGAAVSVEMGGQERVVVVFELKRRYRKANVEDVTEAIRSSVSATHDVEVYAVVLVEPGAIPRTSSGKVRRQAYRSGFLEGTLPVVGASIQRPSPGGDGPMHSAGLSASEVRADLYARIAALLDVRMEDVDLDQPIRMLGLGSLRSVALYAQIEDGYGIELPSELFRDDLTVAELVDKVLAPREAERS